MMNFDAHLLAERNAPRLADSAPRTLFRESQVKHHIYRAPTRAKRNWAWNPKESRA